MPPGVDIPVLYAKVHVLEDVHVIGNR